MVEISPAVFDDMGLAIKDLVQRAVYAKAGRRVRPVALG